MIQIKHKKTYQVLPQPLCISGIQLYLYKDAEYLDRNRHLNINNSIFKNYHALGYTSIICKLN